jgi:tripeptidyl-peptidase I
MRFLGSTVLVVAAAASVAAKPVPHTHQRHEKREAQSNVWVKRSRIEPKLYLPMRIGLVQSNLDQAHDLLMNM